MHRWIGGVGIAIHIVATRTGINGIAGTERAVIGPIIRRNEGAIAAVVATYPASLGGQCGAEDRCGEDEFD